MWIKSGFHLNLTSFCQDLPPEKSGVPIPCRHLGWMFCLQFIDLHEVFPHVAPSAWRNVFRFGNDLVGMFTIPCGLNSWLPIRSQEDDETESLHLTCGLCTCIHTKTTSHGFFSQLLLIQDYLPPSVLAVKGRLLRGVSKLLILVATVGELYENISYMSTL